MIIVEDHIDDCLDGNHKLMRRYQKVAVHRLIVKHDDGRPFTTAEYAELFRDRALGTGGEFPYHALVYPTGVIHQCLPLDERGAHAARWNTSAYGVAFIGDFRKEGPTAEAIESGAEFCSYLCAKIGQDPIDAIVAHDELPGGSKDPNKACPGQYFYIDDFRNQAQFLYESAPVTEIQSGGLLIC